MRGTLHFVAAEDLRWLLALTAQRTLVSAATRRARLGLTEEIVERARQLALTELSGGGAITRDEFLRLLNAAGIETTAGRGYHLIFQLAQNALICWGPSRQIQQALVLVDEWIPPQTPLDKPVALGEFVRRYFTGHGPATLKDFAWWSKLTLTDARAGLAVARAQLTEVTHGGQSYFMAPDAMAPDATTPDATAPDATALAAVPAPKPAGSPADSTTRVLALPGFDEYLLGYTDRDLPLERRFADRIVPGGNGIFLPTIVVDGRVVGTWQRVRRARSSSVTPVPFEQLSAGDATAFEAAATRFVGFVGDT